MKKFLKNPWVIGIGTTVFAALIMGILKPDSKELTQFTLKQTDCPVVPIKYDGQGFFLENLDNQPFILESSSEEWLGDASTAKVNSTINIPEVLKPGDTFRINLGILGYSKKITYQIKPRLRNLKANKVYETTYEITADVIENGTHLTNHKVLYKGCSEV